MKLQEIDYIFLNLGAYGAHTLTIKFSNLGAYWFAYRLEVLWSYSIADSFSLLSSDMLEPATLEIATQNLTKSLKDSFC